MTAPRYNTIAKLLRPFRNRYGIYDLFSDCIEAMAIAISNALDKSQAEQREARYMQIVKRYDKDVLSAFAQILAEITMAMEEEPGDVLGQLFGALELHNTDRGQFFTPDCVSRFMAKLTLADGAEISRIIEEHGYVTVNEPACGAGAMLIAFALEMRELGHNYQRNLHVTAVDIDRRAIHMAYVQLSLLHIPAVLIVGNSLTLEEREHWYTPAHILGRWSDRLRADRSRWLVEQSTAAAEQKGERPAEPEESPAEQVPPTDFRGQLALL